MSVHRQNGIFTATIIDGLNDYAATATRTDIRTLAQDASVYISILNNFQAASGPRKSTIVLDKRYLLALIENLQQHLIDIDEDIIDSQEHIDEFDRVVGYTYVYAEPKEAATVEPKRHSLPIEPGRYVDRDGDTWTLYESGTWLITSPDYDPDSVLHPDQYLPMTPAKG